jgi:hypothetical protein
LFEAVFEVSGVVVDDVALLVAAVWLSSAAEDAAGEVAELSTEEADPELLSLLAEAGGAACTSEDAAEEEVELVDGMVSGCALVGAAEASGEDVMFEGVLPANVEGALVLADVEDDGDCVSAEVAASDLAELEGTACVAAESAVAPGPVWPPVEDGGTDSPVVQWSATSVTLFTCKVAPLPFWALAAPLLPLGFGFELAPELSVVGEELEALTGSPVTSTS